MFHALCQFHTVGYCVGTFDGGDDAFQSGQFKEGVDGLFVIDNVVLDTPDFLQKCVFGAGRGIVKAACYRVYGSRLAVFILQHNAVETVHNAFGSVL